jgi:imidazoleglycerol-phosphate dehydratase
VSETRSEARIAPATEGAAAVETGLPVLDHLVAELARTGRFRVSLEVAPGSADEAVAAAGQAFGRAVAARLDAQVVGVGWAMVPADEALALVALEHGGEGRLVTNVDFSDERVGGVSTDVALRFLDEIAREARLNLHVRVVEGTDPQHVLTAIFKAVGASLGQALQPVPRDSEEAP